MLGYDDMPLYLKENLDESDFAEKIIKKRSKKFDLDLIKKDKNRIEISQQKFNMYFDLVNKADLPKEYQDFRDSMNWIYDHLLAAIDADDLTETVKLSIMADKFSKKIDEIAEKSLENMMKVKKDEQ